MEGNLPSNKNQELNIRQSFLHLNNSNSKACVKIFFWKYPTALSTSNYKKTQYISFKQNNVIVFSLRAKIMLQKFVDFTVPTKHEDITVRTFRFSDVGEESCHIGMALSSGTILSRTVDLFFFFFLRFPLNHKYARPLCIFSAYIYYCIYQSYR